MDKTRLMTELPMQMALKSIEWKLIMKSVEESLLGQQKSSSRGEAIIYTVSVTEWGSIHKAIAWVPSEITGQIIMCFF